MTILSAFRDYIGTQQTPAYLGKIPNAQEMCLGVYGVSNGLRVEALGCESSYDIAGFRILVHGNMNARITEQTARDLFQRLRYVTDTQMGDYFVNYIDLDTGEPTFIGTDENNVYEFHISGQIYYRR
jgi:hypothetical protein